MRWCIDQRPVWKASVSILGAYSVTAHPPLEVAAWLCNGMIGMYEVHMYLRLHTLFSNGMFLGWTALPCLITSNSWTMHRRNSEFDSQAIESLVRYGRRVVRQSKYAAPLSSNGDGFMSSRLLQSLRQGCWNVGQPWEPHLLSLSQPLSCQMVKSCRHR